MVPTQHSVQFCRIALQMLLAFSMWATDAPPQSLSGFDGIKSGL
jgi:hypothetical protein